MCIDVADLLTACQAIVFRLRRICSAIADGSATDLAAADAARIASCTALLNFLSALDVDGAYPDERAQIRKAVEIALNTQNGSLD
jgi:hypothetical protein